MNSGAIAIGLEMRKGWSGVVYTPDERRERMVASELGQLGLCDEGFECETSDDSSYGWATGRAEVMNLKYQPRLEDIRRSR